jgi:hypothetical protein
VEGFSPQGRADGLNAVSWKLWRFASEDPFTSLTLDEPVHINPTCALVQVPRLTGCIVEMRYGQDMSMLTSYVDGDLLEFVSRLVQQDTAQHRVVLQQRKLSVLFDIRFSFYFELVSEVLEVRMHDGFLEEVELLLDILPPLLLVFAPVFKEELRNCTC